MKMNWSADYVARVDPDGGTLSLTGWITLANFSDTSFHDVPAQVIAGNPRTTGADRAVQAQARWIAPQCWPLDIDWSTWPPAPPAPPPPPAPRHGRDGGRHRLAHPRKWACTRRPPLAWSSRTSATTSSTPCRCAPRSPRTRPSRSRFSTSTTSSSSGSYIYGVPVEWDNDMIHGPEPAQVRYRLHNTDEAGLGKPLPGGTLSVIDGDGRGGSVFVGQARLWDTPVGLPVTIDTGGALAVRVLPRIAAREDERHGERRAEPRQGRSGNCQRHGQAGRVRAFLEPRSRRNADRRGGHGAHPRRRREDDMEADARNGERRIFRYTVDYPNHGERNCLRYRRVADRLNPGTGGSAPVKCLPSAYRGVTSQLAYRGKRQFCWWVM